MASVDPSRIAFEPVGTEHLPLIAGWLKAPHVREYWADPEDELALLREMVEGRDTSRPFLMLQDGRPFGYIQMWFLEECQSEGWLADHPWIAAFSRHAVGIDVMIGEVELLSGGFGSAALNLFCRRLAADGHDVIVADPDSTNGRALRAFEKAGFHVVPKRAGWPDDVTIMLFQPAL